MARSVLRDGQEYDDTVTRMSKKVARTAYAMPA